MSNKVIMVADSHFDFPKEEVPEKEKGKIDWKELQRQILGGEIKNLGKEILRGK